MIVLVGESASGKSSIERYLVEHHGYKKIISYTTREPRENEIDGVDYYFIDEDKFHELECAGFFAETAIYNNWHYGTAKEDYSDDKIAVLTPHGLRLLRQIPELNLIVFYIKVPRRDRLIKILQRGDNIEEAYRRNVSDVGMFDGIEDEVDYVLENPNYCTDVRDMAWRVDFWARKEKIKRGRIS